MTQIKLHFFAFFMGLIWQYHKYKGWIPWIWNSTLRRKIMMRGGLGNFTEFQNSSYQNFSKRKSGFNSIYVRKIPGFTLAMIFPKILTSKKPQIAILKIHGIRPKYPVYPAWIIRKFSLHWIFEISSLIWVIFWNVFCLQAWRNIYSLWPHLAHR